MFTFPVPFVIGFGFAQQLGIWVGIAAAVLSWLFATIAMVALWAFCNRSTRDKYKQQTQSTPPVPRWPSFQPHLFVIMFNAILRPMIACC
jgi:hypothetical protein